MKNVNLLIRSIFVILLVILISIQENTAQIVSGTVISASDNTPLIGATVLVKGQSNGTTTDLDGHFEITAELNDIIEVSFLGFSTQDISITNLEDINVLLTEDSELLSEVLVLGYSSRSQKQLSAALTTLKSDKLQQITSSNVETMLQGQVAGLTVSSSSGAPGAAADIRIRGITSINADRAPLFVVDGMIGGGYVPNDVESITVLKDAAAIGLYGAAGAAGVIIINTKQGVSEKPSFSFSARRGKKEATTGSFQMMNGEQLYAAQSQMWGENNLVSFLTNRPEDLEDLSFDWLDAAFNSADVQNYSLSARGKSKDVQYGFSADYFDEQGTFINTEFQRLNLRGNLKFNVSDKFSLHTDINAQFAQSSNEYFSWFEDAFWNVPWDRPTDEAGNYYGPQFVTNPRNDWYGQFRRSFLYSTQFNDIGSANDNLIWSIRSKFDITDWLSFETRTRLDTYKGNFNQYYSPQTDEGLAISGFVGVDENSGRGISSTQFLRFQKNFGRHDISGFLAHEGGINKVFSSGTYGQNLSSTTIDVISGASNINAYGSNITFKGISYISELTYSLDEKYLATAYFRRDGSSLFAENKRFGNFYGGSLGWLVSSESFLSRVKAINYLKLRASYGLSGNSNIPPFLNLATYDITRQYNQQPAGEPNNPANPNLGWETTRMFNVGADMRFLDRNLELNVDVYQKTVEGMLLNNPLPFSSGYQARTENIGNMRNRGIEAAISYRKKIGKFGFSVGGNIAYNQNMITKVTDVLNEQTIQAGAIQQVNQVGEAAFQWYMPKWLGVNPEDGNPVWERVVYDDNGEVIDRVGTDDYTQATFQANGSALPKLTGGVNTSFGLGSVDLSFLFTFQSGNKIYHYTREFVDSDGANTGINLMVLADGWSRWENQGDIATHPRLNRGGNNGAHQSSSRYIERGDYFRLRNVSLSYQLPKKILSKVGVKGASVAVNADNIFTITEFSGMDPDVGLSVQAFSLPGMSYLKYPISRQLALSLNVEF